MTAPMRAAAFRLQAGRPAASQRNRHPTKQHIAKRYRALAAKSVHHFSHNVLGVRAKRGSKFRAVLSQSRYLHRPFAVPFHDATGRTFANAPGIADLDYPSVKQEVSSLPPKPGRASCADFAATPILAAHCRASSAAVVSLPPITEIMCWPRPRVIVQ